MDNLQHPSSHIEKSIIESIENKMFWENLLIYFKFLSIIATTSIVTLFFCPQFNLSFTNNHELYHFFHHTFGEVGCMMICGVLFSGTGSILAGIILNKFEQKIIGLKNILLLIVFSVSSLLLFILIRGEFIRIDLMIYWASSGIILSSTFFYLSKKSKEIITRTFARMNWIDL